MKFGQLAYAWALWLVPALCVFYLYAFKRRRFLLRRFCESDQILQRLLPSVSWGRRRLKAGLLITAVVFCVIALLQPRWGYHWEDVTRRGVDLIVAIDVSESMLAEDLSPNRLERAKREVSDLIQMLDGDRIGLVAFAGASFVQCPLTLDYGTARLFLDNLDTSLIPIPGTNLGAAMKKAVDAFKGSAKHAKALILITDGEDHGGEPLVIAKEAAAAGVRIFTIGVGQEGGAPIPLKSVDGGFKKDNNGQVILTKLDEKTLQNIALATGGSYVRSVSGDMDLEKIYRSDIKQKLKDQELKGTRQKKWEERFQWFLLVALLLFSAELLLPEQRVKREEVV